MLLPHQVRLQQPAMARDRPKARARKEHRERAEPIHLPAPKARQHVVAAHRRLALEARDRAAPARRVR
jgi:hypothetical protein